MLALWRFRLLSGVLEFGAGTLGAKQASFVSLHFLYINNQYLNGA
jgi:hypothetical protein